MLKGFLNALGILCCATIMAAMIMFVTVNWMIGCEDWSDPACVTPADLIK